MGWGLDFVSEGEKQLSLNNPTKALTYLEAALAQGTPDERLLLDLGLAYQRAGQVADAKRMFRQGAELGGPARKIFLLDWGIANYLTQDWAGAEEAYSAAIATDPSYAEALLNRANSRINGKNLSGAAEDYRAYQTVAPTNPQKEKIDNLLALLDQAVGDAEAARLAEETRKKNEAEAQQAVAAAAEADKQKAQAAADAQRQAQEAAALAEKQKQDEILARIRESLAGASGDSQTLSTGPSGVKADDGEFSLDP
jgi:Tfp pilus assembly protein PilF